MAEGPVRIRVEFDDTDLLSDSHRLKGLDRSWLLVKPEMASIADVALHLKRSFGIERHSILLSMDGYILPPYESTCLLKDKDIIRVRKIGTSLVDVIGSDGDDENHAKVLCFKARQPISSHELLAITEFEEELSGRHSEDEDDSCHHNEIPVRTRTPKSKKTSSKRKRKYADKTSGSKGKKQKLLSSEIPGASTEMEACFHSGRKVGSSHIDEHCSEDDRLDTLATQVEDTVEEMCSREKKKKKKTKSKPTKWEKSIAADVDDSSKEQTCNGFVKGDGRISKLSTVATEERTEEPEENSAPEPGVTGSSTKLPSRNARRKKARRKWLREIQSKENKDNLNGKLPNAIEEKPEEHDEKVLNSEKPEEVVPVVIRPGHIRFGPLDDEEGEEENLCQSQEPTEILQWNGITNKKKGQKWGRQNSKRDDVNVYKEQSYRYSYDEDFNDNEKSITEERKGSKKSVSRDNGKSTNQGWISNGKHTAEDAISNGGHVAEEANDKGNSIVEKKISDGNIDFESLLPLPRPPQEGDSLVYRLVELSSSWCPEPSPFRVGKVSSYDPSSKMIILDPVPEYPISPPEDAEEEDLVLYESNMAAYKEDGSLEVHYPSLVDVRLLKASTVNTEKMNASTITTPIANESDSSWEQIQQAISEKKTQLQKKVSSDDETPNVQKKNGADDETPKTKERPSWADRAMRRSALGPTLAFLRGKNELHPAAE